MHSCWAVAVVQLAERSLLYSKDPGLNTAISNFYIECLFSVGKLE